MSLSMEQIEHLERMWGGKSRSRKWIKNQRNRRIRRTQKEEIPFVNKYKGWEY